MLVEANHQNNADGDTAVGKIENGWEEVASSENRDSIRNREQVEIKHIHNPSVHERCVVVCDSVESGIHDVSECAGHNQRKHASGEHVNLFSPNASDDIVDDEAHHAYADERQQQFPEVLAETQPERHTLVFNEMQIEPMPENRDDFT